MIYQRAALREFANTSIAVFVALLAVMLTTQLIRLLAEAAGGKLASEAVLALMGFAAINYLPTLLSLSLFIAVLLSLARAYRDSEMVVWFSSGLSLTAWIRPVLAFALPIVLIIAVLSIFLSPWAISKSLEFRQKMKERDDVSQVAPGSFKESSMADRVFFVEAVAGDERLVKNVFISSMQHGKLGVMAAARGYQQLMANGDRFLVLENGRRYEGVPGQADYRVMEFERYAVRVETRESQGFVETPKSLPLQKLLENPTPPNLGQILWRVGVPLAAFILALLAIPLSFVNPRAGRANNLIFAILIYMIYSNLISISQAWVSQGRLSFGMGVWIVHAAVLVLLLLLFFRRLTVFSWGRLWR
ncbi:putative permease [Sterolibacterium denitrificans]|uniref:Lipopolysaccharide export system permease protein LptF n=1 Tax=Sterolibacterium denitrificans TaxID=157592 RepID=A0A7Z7HQZ2_9PROT|nr:LPS export ABC transporter permease LptF [Sterolibacterium denitrificans]SMB26291.1 putative permease [Sterolibacterium denitrificans]